MRVCLLDPGNRRAQPWFVDTATGTQTSVGSFNSGGASANLNGLGIAADGSAAFGVLPDNTGTGRTIYRLDRSTETTVPLGAGEAGTPVTHGAIDPATGFRRRIQPKRLSPRRMPVLRWQTLGAPSLTPVGLPLSQPAGVLLLGTGPGRSTRPNYLN